MKHLKKFNEEIGNPREVKLEDFYQQYKNIVDFNEDDFEQGEEPSRVDLLSEIGDLCNELDMSKSDVKWVLDNYDCSFDIDGLLQITHDEWVDEGGNDDEVFTLQDIRDTVTMAFRWGKGLEYGEGPEKFDEEEEKLLNEILNELRLRRND
jgi:hypothetical protein